MSYVSAWYCDTPESIISMRVTGANGFIVPANSESQVDAVLAVMNSDEIAVLDLSQYGARYWAPDAVLAATAYVERYADEPKVAGFLLFDEPNNGGQSDSVAQHIQKDWYAACKTYAPDKLVYVNYAVGPVIPDVGCIVTTPGQAWDQVMVDYYCDTYDVTLEQAAANLSAACTAVRALFPLDTSIHFIQQAAGCSVDPGVAPRLRPINGNLKAQYDIVYAAGLTAVSRSLVYYGWGTNPEDHNLNSDATLRNEVTVVIAAHKIRHG